MYYTGIDHHKLTSYLTTVDNKGVIIKQVNLNNDDFEIPNLLDLVVKYLVCIRANKTNIFSQYYYPLDF